MPGPPAEIQAKIAQNAADKKAREDAERQRQIMAMTNDPNYVTTLTSYNDSEDKYFDSLLQKIGWAYDSIFTEADADKLAEDVEFSEDDITGLTTKGLNKTSAPNNTTSMWRELSASQTGTEKKIVHYFEQVYKKLGCCMGKDELTIHIPRYNRATKKMETTERTIVIDRGTCKINGIDYNDDNFSESGYKPACERFMKRFIAFLLKYEPTNPMIKKYGGCLANKFLSEGVKTNPKLYNIINNNRSCTVNECSASSYKRLGDRKNCETVFCEAITNISDIDAGRDASLQTSISQNCGSSVADDYAKKTEDKPESEEDKINTAIQEAVKESEQKPIDITIADEEGFVFNMTNFFNSISSFFSNLFGSNTENFTNLKMNYRYLIIFAMITSITIYIYRKQVFKIIKYILKNPLYIPLF